MGWIGALPFALGLAGIVGAVFDTDIKANVVDRAAQIAFDVGGKGFERRNIKGVKAGAIVCAQLGQGRKKPRQRLAAAGWCNQQKGRCRRTLEHLNLVRMQGPAILGKPIVKSGGTKGHGRTVAHLNKRTNG